ncbi:uncharacterized protein LOC134234751 isoform X2 [Saccostrea cucullata]|uniref:uncharacterized protein LOC134234751 isoform X2 n=1 Tax=Saccostrea cuccullata TaxID=36930 RepID=UPI002ED57025
MYLKDPDYHAAIINIWTKIATSALNVQLDLSDGTVIRDVRRDIMGYCVGPPVSVLPLTVIMLLDAFVKKELVFLLYQPALHIKQSK